MSLFACLLASYGICFCLIHKAKFMRKVAFFEKMFNCVFCTGFHAGWITYILLNFSNPPVMPFDWAEFICMAFASATFCYTLDTAIIYLEYKTAKLKQPQNDHPNLFS